MRLRTTEQTTASDENKNKNSIDIITNSFLNVEWKSIVIYNNIKVKITFRYKLELKDYHFYYYFILISYYLNSFSFNFL